MRIDAVSISNFRGIERAELDNLAASPLVTVSGPNGAGKSLMFEAIALLWRIVSVWERRAIVPSSVIGPWADTCEIGVAVVLSDDERAALATYAEKAGLPEPEDSRASMRLNLVHGDRPPEVEVDEWESPLWTLDFTSKHAFANVDYFPADRAFPRGEQPTVIRRC